MPTVDFGPGFTAQSIAVDGATLNVHVGGSGPPVVLIHGYAQNSAMWKPLAKVLTPRFTIIAPDLPGIGHSSIPATDIDMSTSAARVRTPEALVAGRERLYLDSLWNGFAGDGRTSLSEADRTAYATAYAGPGRMAAGFEFFRSFPKTAAEFAEFAKEKLTMPVLSLGGEKSLGEALGAQVRTVGADVKVVVLKDVGHWMMEESPSETMAVLERFL